MKTFASLILLLLASSGTVAAVTTTTTSSSLNENAAAVWEATSRDDMEDLTALHNRVLRSLQTLTNFDGVCRELRAIFNNQCDCGQISAAASNQVVCSTSRTSATAQFDPSQDFELTSLNVCQGPVCTSIQYSTATQTAQSCSVSVQGQSCSECYLCEQSDLLGLTINCDNVDSKYSRPCTAASTLLDLSAAPSTSFNKLVTMVMAAAGMLMLWL